METKENGLNELNGLNEKNLFDRIKKSLVLNKSYSIKLNENYRINMKNGNNEYKSYIDSIIFFFIDSTLNVRYTCITEINNLLTSNYYYVDILIDNISNLNDSLL